MPEYKTYNLDLKEHQHDSLAEGKRIKLKPEQLHGGTDTVYLTATQIKNIESAKAAGKGITLQFSKTQLRHQEKHGSGRFTDFLKRSANKVWEQTKKAAKWVAQTHGDKIKSYANEQAGRQIDRGIQYAQDKVQGLTNRLPEQVNMLVGSVLDDALHLAQNGSKRQIESYLNELHQKHGRGIAHVGAGLFDFLGKDVGGFLNTLGNTALGVAMPIVSAVAGNRLNRALGGGLKAPGY